MMIDEMIQESEMNTLIEMGNYIEKEFYMEAVQGLERINIPDATSKWTQFKNWITRAINKILAMIHSVRFKNALKKCENLNTSGEKHSISKYHKYMFQRLMSIRKVDSYKESIQSYAKDHMKEYKINSINYQKQLNAFKNKQVEGTIDISGEQLTKILEWIKNDGKDMATELPNVNKYLREIGKNLEKEDRESKEFKQYIQMITIKIQVDLNLVKEMVKFLGDLAKNAPKGSSTKSTSTNQTSGTDEKSSTAETSGTTETSKKSSSESSDDGWTVVTIPNDAMDLCNQYVFDKYPGCKEIRIKGSSKKGKFNIDYHDGTRNHHHPDIALKSFMHVPIIGGILKRAITPDKLSKAENGGIIIKR